MEVVQVSRKRFAKSSVLGIGKDGAAISEAGVVAAERLRGEIVGFLARLTDEGERVFVAATKAVADALRAIELPDGVMLGHFGRQRGSNAWKDCTVAVVIGREQPPPATVETLARCYFANDPDPFLSVAGTRYLPQSRPRRHRDGSTTWGETEVHPDLRCQAVLEAIREAEIMQAVDRVRPIFNRRRIFVLTALPLDLTIDRVVAWSHLAGTAPVRVDRMGEIMRRLGMLPLSARWLHHIAPDLFVSEKAAQHAIERERVITPTALNRGLLERLGVITLAEFRHLGQRGPKPTRVIYDAERFRDRSEFPAHDLVAAEALCRLLGVEITRFDCISE